MKDVNKKITEQEDNSVHSFIFHYLITSEDDSIRIALASANKNVPDHDLLKPSQWEKELSRLLHGLNNYSYKWGLTKGSARPKRHSFNCTEFKMQLFL